MNKAILVTDMSENCLKCNLRYDNYGLCEICILADEVVDYFYENNTKPDWCPLKEAPVKIDAPDYDNSIKAKNKNAEEVGMYMYDRGIYTGYNLCIDKILGER